MKRRLILAAVVTSYFFAGMLVTSVLLAGGQRATPIQSQFPGQTGAVQSQQNGDAIDFEWAHAPSPSLLGIQQQAAPVQQQVAPIQQQRVPNQQRPILGKPQRQTQYQSAQQRKPGQRQGTAIQY